MNDQHSKPVDSSQSAAAHRRARLGLGIGVPGVILAATYVPYFLFRSELPDRVASHFDSAGRADDSMTVGVFLAVTGVMVAMGLALSVGLALNRRPLPFALGATVGFLGPFIAALGGGVLASTAVTQRGIERWQDAPNAWSSLVVVIAAATAAGVAGAWLGARLPVITVDPGSRNAPVMDLDDGQHAVWSTSLRSTPLLLLGLAAAVFGVVLVVTGPPWAGIGVLASSFPLTALATVRVNVDRSGLRVRYGNLPWPSTRVATDRIESASAIDVRPREWGGWGYRGSLTLTRRAAVVHRAGPGIRLDLTDGKVFVVTVDDPETGVALLNAHIQRRVRNRSRPAGTADLR